MANPRDTQNRREFLGRLSIALSALAGAVISIPIIAYLLGPLIHPPINLWRSLGTVASFPVGQTVERSYEDPSPLPWAGLTARTAVWVRRNSPAENDFTVFAVNCTHLGCPVHWLPTANLFICPCHGGVYYANGNVAAGPPPHALFRYQSRVTGGQIQILTRPLPVE